MTTEARSGSHAIKCDCPHCHIELIRRTREQVQEEASLLGWKFDVANDRHLCSDCQQGNCPGEAVAAAKYGAARVMMPAPGPVKKGAKVAGPDGRVIGTALNEVQAKGEPLMVSLAGPPDPSKAGGEAPEADDGKLRIEDAVVVGGRGDGAPS